jgi:hypothetical protein
MAAILKLRRGTSFTSLQETEFFYHQGLETILIGDGSGSNTGHKTLVKLTELNSGSIYLNGDITGSHISASGNITASNLKLSGDADIVGNITLGGDIFLGDGTNATDNINVNASFSGSLIPTTTDVFTIGSVSKKYLDLRVISASIDHIILPGSGILSSSVTDFTDYSQSVDLRLDVEEAKSVTLGPLTASYDIRLDNLQATSASHDNRLDVEEAKSTTLATVTSSLDQRADRLEAYTSSFASDTVTLTNKTINGANNTLTVDISRDTNLAVSDTTEVNMILTDDTISAELIGGVVTGSSQINADSITNFDANVKTKLDDETVVSGSSQINYSALSGINNNIISASSDTSQVDMVIDGGSISANLKGGVVSGSSQIDADQTTGWVADVKTQLNSNTVISGSSQVDYSSISGINNNIISSSTDSSQVDMIINGGSISANLKGGVVSGSSQVNSLFIGTAVSTSLDTRLDTIEGPFSTSVDSRLDSLETDTHTHSNKSQLDTINQNLSTTSNVTFNTGSFTGDMTVTGNLTVLGSATEIQTSELRIEDKLITVASGSADSAAADGAGLEVAGAGKSLKWDHNTSQFVLDAKVSSSVGFKGEGGELTGIDTDQVTEGSNLYYTDTRVKTKLDGDGVISGSIQLHTDLDARYLEINGDSVVSGSSQIDADQTTGWVADVRKQIDNVGLISGSVQVNANTITNFDTNVKAKLDAETVVSGSSQISGITNTQLAGSIANSKLTNSAITISGTSVSLGSSITDETLFGGVGVVSGSSQINYSSLSGINNNIISSSSDTSQVDMVINGGSISANLKGGVVSGSSQIDADQTTGWVADVRKQIDNVGLISGSSQVNANTITNFDTNVKAKLDAETVISGSTFSSPSQGTVRATINGANTDVDTGLQTGDSPEFTTLTLSNVAAGGSTDFDALFNVSGLLKKRTIGTAAFLNVSASIADDPNSIPTTKAVNDALVEAGAGDITSVNTSNLYPSASTGIAHTSQGTVDGSGRFGNVGNVVLAIDTGSAHFQQGVELYSSDIALNGVISGSAQLANSTVSNESLNAATSSYLTTVDISSNTNLAVSDTTNVDMILTGDTISANLKGGVVSGSSQIDHDTTTNFVAAEHINHSSISVGSGKGLDGGGTIDTNRSIFLDTGSAHFTEGVDLRLGSLNSATGSYLTAHPNISAGSNISQDNSNGTVIQDIAITLDSNGHVTTATAGTVDLDGRYYTETESDTLFTKKLGQGVLSGSAQIASDISGSFTSVSASIDNRLDTLEGDVHENVLTFNDTSTIDLNRSTNTITANVIGGIFSGSAQVAAGGDVSGNVNSLTVEKIQGVSLTSGEATQLATIGTSTISATQWGYLGGMDQDVKTTSNVSFASASLSNVTISGNLKVLGDSVEIAVSDLKIEDKLITVASGSSDSAAADGAGIEIAGANESITWNHGSSRFDISDDIHITGTIKASDDIIAYASSDIELKNNIKPIENPIDKIKSISGNSFDWNEEKQDIYKGKDYGVIAQEIEKVLPELVITRENGYKAVKYDKLVSLLIEGIKDLSNQIDELKKDK